MTRRRFVPGGIDRDLEPAPLLFDDDKLQDFSHATIGDGGAWEEKDRAKWDRMLEHGAIGGLVEVFPAGSRTVIRAGGDDRLAETVNVTLIPPPTFYAPPAINVLRANVKFGNDRVQSAVDVDYARGCSFSLPASFVQVDAFNDSTGAAATASLSFGGFITRRPLSNPVRPQFTQRTGSLAAAAASAITAIPPFAATLKADRNLNADGSPFTVEFIDSTAANVFASQIVAANADMAEVPITGLGATHWRLTNNSALVAANFSLIWGLSI